MGSGWTRKKTIMSELLACSLNSDTSLLHTQKINKITLFIDLLKHSFECQITSSGEFQNRFFFAPSKQFVFVDKWKGTWLGLVNYTFFSLHVFVCTFKRTEKSEKSFKKMAKSPEQYAAAIAIACLIGTGLSLYSYYVATKLDEDGAYEAMCDISEQISCTKLYTSE